MLHLLLNILFGLLAFFLTRLIGSMVVPEGRDAGQAVTIVAIIVGIIVFFANFAAQVL